MTITAGMTDAEQAGNLRVAMTDRLVADGMIGSPEVEAAFRTMPRHVFVPSGTPVDDAYGADVAVISRRPESCTRYSIAGAPAPRSNRVSE